MIALVLLIICIIFSGFFAKKLKDVNDEWLKQKDKRMKDVADRHISKNRMYWYEVCDLTAVAVFFSL